MVQNAQSMAFKFDTEEQVRHKMTQLRQKYKGIGKIDFEIVSSDFGFSGLRATPFGKTPAKKLVNVGHQILKPVKKGDEYVVKWLTNGKRNEQSTYYTDDKEDANATYLRMIKQADELNAHGL